MIAKYLACNARLLPAIVLIVMSNSVFAADCPSDIKAVTNKDADVPVDVLAYREIKGDGGIYRQLLLDSCSSTIAPALFSVSVPDSTLGNSSSTIAPALFYYRPSMDICIALPPISI